MVRYVLCVSVLDHEGNVIDRTRIGGDLEGWDALRESLETYLILGCRLGDQGTVYLYEDGEVVTVTWIEYYVGDVPVDVSELYYQLVDR